MVSLNLCHSHYTPIVTWFYGRNTVSKLLLRALQHNPLFRRPSARPICSRHSYLCQNFAEHTASVFCLCTEFILCAACVVGWQPYIWAYSATFCWQISFTQVNWLTGELQAPFAVSANHNLPAYLYTTN